jgi:hypothetical protein
MILGKLQELTTNISNLTKIVEYLIDQKRDLTPEPTQEHFNNITKLILTPLHI